MRACQSNLIGLTFTWWILAMRATSLTWCRSKILSPHILSREQTSLLCSFSTQIERVCTPTLPSFSVGDKVKVKLLRFTPLGAAVSINFETANGLIFKNDLQMHQAKMKLQRPLKAGDSADAYVLRICDDGKIDVSLRPPFVERILQTKSLLLDTLSAASTRSIPIGDKSSATAIGEMFPGVSKGDFKNAVGALYRDGLVLVSPRELKLQLHEQKREYVGKTLFVGNLAPAVTLQEFEDAVDDAAKKLGADAIPRKARLVAGKTESARGVAFVEFVSQAIAMKMREALDGVRLKGAHLRVSYAIPTKAKKLTGILDDDTASGTGTVRTTNEE